MKHMKLFEEWGNSSKKKKKKEKSNRPKNDDWVWDYDVDSLEYWMDKLDREDKDKSNEN